MRNSTALISAIVIGALIGGVTMGIPSIRHRLIPATTTAAATTETAPAQTAENKAAPAPEQQEATPAQNNTESTDTANAAKANTITPSAGIDTKTALKDRVLGNADAPLTFYDYSSLSCPHCADFHTNVLPRIKRDYIDTGKVKMVFRPFPLNQPALLGEQIARCVPEEEYFPMLDLLFTNQEKWVFGDAKANLRQMVKVAGVTDALFDECLKNKLLEQGIVDIASDGSKRFEIKGTPTFIIGEDNSKGEIVSGETDYDSFSQKLDKILMDRMIETPKKK